MIAYTLQRLVEFHKAVNLIWYAYVIKFLVPALWFFPFLSNIPSDLLILLLQVIGITYIFSRFVNIISYLCTVVP